MFIFIVVPSRNVEDGVPRDVQLIFTEAFSQQNMIRNEKGRYTAALLDLGLEKMGCERYSCLLTSAPDGNGYQFRLSKEGKTWVINNHSPVPVEETK